MSNSNGRREMLKALATVPLLGAMGYGIYKKTQYTKMKRNVRDVFQLDKQSPTIIPAAPDGKTIRLGIIGNGIRGKLLMRSCGFATPEYVDKIKKDGQDNPQNKRYEIFKNQDDLNVRIVAVCDIFDTFADEGVRAGANIYKEGTDGKFGAQPKRYLHYKELLADPEVDAVIIATPDHWHGTMAIDAALSGKHIYLEKPATWTVPETYLLRDVIRNSGVVFQLGHQGRQTDSYIRAKEIIDKGILGQVNLIEVCTNRNDPNGAWVYDIHPDANPSSIDWKQFMPDETRLREYLEYMSSNGLDRYMGPEPFDQFSLERFFRWRCWWDYSTGLSGDLLTHEYDAVNQIMGVGIPHSATSSGGVYFFKDGRTVPDVLQTTFEFPEKNLTMLYSATLASNRKRGKVFMGHDANMELGTTLTVKVDRGSTRYKDKLAEGIIQPDVPFYNYIPGSDNIDAISSATELYFAQRGLLYTYVNGKQYDTTFLHIREWLECIRQDLEPSCGIDAAFEEAMAAHMGTRAYLEGRTMYWDKDKEEIVRG
ncbi:MAG: Gfo/Idh/MocA family oxidoreductase [Bacteroidales bacterium]